MKTIDLVTSGYVSLDRIIRINPKARVGKTSLVQNDDNASIHFGGCGINVSTSLSRLGKTALPIIRVGDDYETSGFKAHLENEGISTNAVLRIQNVGTSCCYLVENPASEHMTLFYPGSMAPSHFRPYQPTWFQQAKLALMTVASKTDNEEFLRQIIAADLPLFLGVKMDEDAFPRRFLKTVLAQCTGIFANESEYEWILDILNVTEIQDIFGKYPLLKFVVVTKGKRGSIAMYREGIELLEHVSPIVEAKKFVDAVGSGDAYIAGFVYGWLENKPVPACMRYGATLASYVIEGMGATTSAPTLAQLQSRYHQDGNQE